MTLVAPKAELLRTINKGEITQVQSPGWSLAVADRAIRSMLTEARKHAPLETVGPLFMGRAVEQGFMVELAGPAGPNAEHELTTSYPNVDFYNHCVRRVWRRYPQLWLAGQWHTHPFEDAPHPSPWDLWGAKQDREAGWFAWNEEYFNGRGHLEIIVAKRKARGWWITTNPDRVLLVWESDVGIVR